MFFINLLLVLILVAAIGVIFFNNPIYSVLALILMFILTSILLLDLHVEFLGFALLLIYAGGLAILFLFVVMLLNIKIQKQTTSLQFNSNFALSGGAIFFVLFPILMAFSQVPYFEIEPEFFLSIILRGPDFLSTVYLFTNTNLFFHYLYDQFFLHFLLVGYILLVSMLGILTVLTPFKKKKLKQVNTGKIARRALNSFIEIKRKKK